MIFFGMKIWPLKSVLGGGCVLGWAIAVGLLSASEVPVLKSESLDTLETLYRSFHVAPELSFEEKETAARFATELTAAGFEVTPEIGGHGVVGVLENGPGPVVLLRADMDALPVVEATGLPFASTRTTVNETGESVGVMHACGHDVHMTVAIGTARTLAHSRDSWRGTLVIIGQPAEERGAGARAMLEEGLFERFPLPDYALALHVAPNLPVGSIGLTEGYSMANVDSVDVTLRGVGGHGAIPQSTIDPVVMAAQVVLGLQTITSRELDPLAPAVVTVGVIRGGSKRNVIPSEVTLELTVRTYADAVREQVLRRIREIAEGVARTAGVEEDHLPVISVKDAYTPSLYNDPVLTRRLRGVFAAQFGDDAVRETLPAMVGEDFGRYGRTPEDVPICMFRLGTTAPETLASGEKVAGLHTAGYRPEARSAIATGVSAMVAAVCELLPVD